MPLVNSFFEARNRGKFSFNNLSLSLVNAPKTIDFVALRDEAEKVRMDVWLDHSAYYHELRHYHDLIGSVCGFHLFLEVTAMVDNFLWAIGRSGGEVILPLESTPQGAQAKALYESYRDFFTAVFGDGPVEMASGEDSPKTSPDGKRDLPIKQFRFPIPKVEFACPLIEYPRRNPVTGVWEERLVPLGVRSLLEHVAVDLQLFLAMVGVGPDDVPNRQSLRGLRYFNAWSELYRRDFLPYTAVKITAAFLLGNSDKRVRDTGTAAGSLIALVQAALDIGGYAPIPSGDYFNWEFQHPGLVFAHLLSHWRGYDETEGDIAVVDRLTRPHLNKSYTEYLKVYTDRVETKLQNVLPRHLLPSSARTPLIRLLREDITATHLAIMRSKVADLEAWFDPVRYVQNIHNLPRPPIFITSELAQFDSLDKTVRVLIWTFVLGFVDAIAGEDAVTCPIFNVLPDLGKYLKFPDPADADKETNCTGFIASRSCGRFDGEYLPTQPKCHFVRAMRFLEEDLKIHIRRRSHG